MSPGSQNETRTALYQPSTTSHTPSCDDALGWMQSAKTQRAPITGSIASASNTASQSEPGRALSANQWARHSHHSPTPVGQKLNGAELMIFTLWGFDNAEPLLTAVRNVTRHSCRPEPKVAPETTDAEPHGKAPVESDVQLRSLGSALEGATPAASITASSSANAPDITSKSMSHGVSAQP